MHEPNNLQLTKHHDENTLLHYCTPHYSTRICWTTMLACCVANSVAVSSVDRVRGAAEVGVTPVGRPSRSNRNTYDA